jgi:hypothetical protein
MPHISDPDRIEYCLGPKAIQSYPFPHGVSMDGASCYVIARKLLRTYWWREGDRLHKRMKYLKPYPDSVRVVAEDGGEVCSWSIDDELRMPLDGRG